MSKEPKRPFEVPAEMVAMAEKSFQQARRAFDQFFDAAQSAMTTMEEHHAQARADSKDVAGKIMNFAEQNVASAFAYAEQLMHAKDPQTLVQLHNEYVQSQMRVLSEQTQALADATRQSVARGGRKL